MVQVTLPHKVELRDYQIPLWNILTTHKRAIFLWARRHGKDVSLWNFTIKEAIQVKGLYYYLLPTYKQARRAIWDAMTIEGLKFTDMIPPQLLESKNETEMRIVLINGSIIQLVGTDNYDSIRGTNPLGVVFSEYAYHDPVVWESVISPILRVNKGWAIFNSTPNKHAPKNHYYDLIEMAEKNDKWFIQKITIDDADVLGEEDMQEERDSGTSEEAIRIEYYCEFDVATSGVIFSKQLREAKERITGVTYDKLKPVEVFMDIGRKDYTVILFAQRYGDQIRIIDCEYHNGEDVAFYIDLIEKKSYNVGNINLPHDAYHKRIEAKLSVAEQFKELYGDKVKPIPGTSLLNGIQTTRRMFNRFWFDSEKCKVLLKALENYHYEYDEKRKQYRDIPFHDWSSHFADALRYLAVGWKAEPVDTMANSFEKYLNTKPMSPEQKEVKKSLSQYGVSMVQSSSDGANPFSFK